MNGQMKGTEERKKEGKMESMVCGRAREREGERERGRRKEYRHWQEKWEGERGEGGPVGERLRKEGRLDRNWQNRGKKVKKKKAKLQNEKKLDFSAKLCSPLI